MGGQATAIISRNNALKKYYENPNKCKYCGNIIYVNKKVSLTRKKQFCNIICSSKYYGELRKKSNSSKIFYCKCGNIIKRRTKFCNDCLIKRKIQLRKQRYNINSDTSFTLTTKGNLFKNRKNWQSARSNIQRNARRIFKINNKIERCDVCGYNKFIEICHIKAVSDFDDNALIKEINDIKNLVALCRNHHWEFDHNLITYNNITKTWIL